MDLVDISVDKMGVIDKHNWTVHHIEQHTRRSRKPNWYSKLLADC